MTEQAKHIVAALRNSYDYSERRDAEAASMIESLSKQLDDQTVVIDRIYEQCRTLQKDLKGLGFDSIADMYAQLEQVTRERDAAVNDLRVDKCCQFCVNDETKDKLPFACTFCGSKKSNWRWRGVEVEK